MLQHQRGLYDLAIRLNLGEQTAKQLVTEACRREFWATRKFKKFLTDNVAGIHLDGTGRIVPPAASRRDAQEGKLRAPWERSTAARSKATHEGQTFPPSASYTGGPSISLRASSALYGSEAPFPPVVWFERVVNSALCGFWDRAMPSPPTEGAV